MYILVYCFVEEIKYEEMLCCDCVIILYSWISDSWLSANCPSDNRLSILQCLTKKVDVCHGNFVDFVEATLVVTFTGNSSTWPHVPYMSRDMTKPTKWGCAHRRLGIAWASAQSDQSSLSAWRNLGSLATHWAHSEDSDQTGRMPRLIWVFAGRTATLLVLSCRGSYIVIL